jgi:hypothetical protein
MQSSRFWFPLAALSAALLAGACSDTRGLAPRAALSTSGRDFSGVWWAEHPDQSLRPIDGGPVPLTSAAELAYQSYRTELKAGRLEDATRKYCLPDGLPRLLTAPYPFEVVLTDQVALFRHEARHVYRALPMNLAHPPDARMLDAYMGNSVAHWEGATLVIDSVRFNDETRLDSSGLPHSEQLHLTERWRKLDGGARLQDEITIEDPKVFSRSWTTRISFHHRPDLTVQEYVCGQPHRPMQSSEVAR